MEKLIGHGKFEAVSIKLAEQMRNNINAGLLIIEVQENFTIAFRRPQ